MGTEPFEFKGVTPYVLKKIQLSQLLSGNQPHVAYSWMIDTAYLCKLSTARHEDPPTCLSHVCDNSSVLFGGKSG